MQISFGVLAPKLKEQLKGYVSEDKLAHFDADSDAITRLYVRGYLPPSAVDKARKKLIKNLTEATKDYVETEAN